MASTNLVRLSFIVLFLSCKLREANLESVCQGFKTCGDCMSNADCFWCLDSPEEVTAFPRCFSKSSGTNNGCSRREDPQSGLEVIDNYPIDREAKEDIVLIAPQRAKMQVIN